MYLVTLQPLIVFLDSSSCLCTIKLYLYSNFQTNQNVIQSVLHGVKIKWIVKIIKDKKKNNNIKKMSGMWSNSEYDVIIRILQQYNVNRSLY